MRRGVCSNYLCDLKVGDTVQMTGPAGTAMVGVCMRGPAWVRLPGRACLRRGQHQGMLRGHACVASLRLGQGATP